MVNNRLSSTYIGPDGQLAWHGWRDIPWVSVGDGPDDSKPYRLVRAAHFYSRVVNRWIDLPEGFPTDFYTIPRPFRWWLRMSGDGRTAALLHDWLVTDRPPWSDTNVATDIFIEAMLLAGVGSWQVRAYGWAVRKYGPQWKKQYPYNTLHDLQTLTKAQ